MVAFVAREVRAFLGLLLLAAIVVAGLNAVLTFRESLIALLAFSAGIIVEYRRAEERNHV